MQRGLEKNVKLFDDALKCAFRAKTRRQLWSRVGHCSDLAHVSRSLNEAGQRDTAFEEDPEEDQQISRRSRLSPVDFVPPTNGKIHPGKTSLQRVKKHLEVMNEP